MSVIYFSFSYNLLSDQDSVAVIDFMLDDLCDPAGIPALMGFEMFIQIGYFDFLEAFGFSFSREGQTAFGCPIFLLSGKGKNYDVI